MANPEHLAILKQGVEAWNAWRREAPLVLPDVRGASLRDRDLRGGLFSRTALTGADLQGAYLSQTELFNADLSGADLTLAHLNGAFLDGADLTAAHLGEARMSGVKLRKADLSRADLSKADLRGAILTKATLLLANMEDARLSGANLSGAQLSGARLGRAHLDGSNLTTAYLDGAHLAGAHLYGAELLGATFTAADFAGTRLMNAKMRNCILARLDLSTCVGLQSVVHSGRSSVGTDTLALSSARLPLAFLRKCGVSERFLAPLPASREASQADYYSCMISYSHANTSFAQHLYDRLSARGILCWLDSKSAVLGEELVRLIVDAIQVHDRVLLCCSKQALESYYVRTELTEAFAKEEREGVRILIPLDTDGYLFREAKGPLAERLRDRLAADFTGWEQDNARFEAEFERVVEALRA